jgi:hypothetical protein
MLNEVMQYALAQILNNTLEAAIRSIAALSSRMFFLLVDKET